MKEITDELVAAFYERRNEPGRASACDSAESSEAIQALNRDLELLDEFETPSVDEHFEVRMWESLQGQVAPQEAVAPKDIVTVLPWTRWAYQMAAVMIIFLLGWLLGTAGRFWTTQQAPDSELLALQSEMQRLQQQMTMLMLHQPDAIDRLAGVELSIPLAGESTGIEHRLVDLATSDPNVNVRLAALQALVQSVRRDTVFSELTNALVRDTSPLVQARLIELLSDGDSLEATRILETIREDPSRHPAVRRRAESVLDRML